jgi:hypothetical protein
MSTTRPTQINDDHGDQFPGSLPAPNPSTGPRGEGTEQRIVRMRAAYTGKINSAVQAGREELAHELAERTFAEELSALHAGRRTSVRTPGTRPPGQVPTRLARMGRFTRRSLDRFDRYTVDAFNPGHPYGPDASRPDRSA